MRVYLSGGLLHKALVRELEGPAQGFAGVLAEGLLVNEVDVEVVGSVNGSVHAAVTVEHSKVSLFLLLLETTRGTLTLSSALTECHVRVVDCTALELPGEQRNYCFFWTNLTHHFHLILIHLSILILLKCEIEVRLTVICIMT